MAKYRCTICGYVYDPAEGDSTQGVIPGTAFEDLPDGWTCPVCGALKSDFVKEA
jgi:rubredoxin